MDAQPVGISLRDRATGDFLFRFEVGAALPAWRTKSALEHEGSVVLPRWVMRDEVLGFIWSLGSSFGAGRGARRASRKTCVRPCAAVPYGACFVCPLAILYLQHNLALALRLPGTMQH
jgi:hypothetical protein